LESRRGMQSFQLAPGRNGIGFWSAPAWAVFASFRPRGRELPACAISPTSTASQRPGLLGKAPLPEELRDALGIRGDDEDGAIDADDDGEGDEEYAGIGLVEE
jgi:hypothetical protein